MAGAEADKWARRDAGARIDGSTNANAVCVGGVPC